MVNPDTADTSPTGMTILDLIDFLQDLVDNKKVDPGAEVVFEDEYGCDSLAGGFYFPDCNTLSLIGHSSEITVGEDEDCVMFGDVSLYEPDDCEESCPFDPDPTPGEVDLNARSDSSY